MEMHGSIVAQGWRSIGPVGGKDRRIRDPRRPEDLVRWVDRGLLLRVLASRLGFRPPPGLHGWGTWFAQLWTRLAQLCHKARTAGVLGLHS